jgi:hypothetical protein
MTVTLNSTSHRRALISGQGRKLGLIGNPCPSLLSCTSPLVGWPGRAVSGLYHHR